MFQKYLILAIKFYQGFISFDKGILSIFGTRSICKYPISCSEYSIDMINRYGSFKGIFFGLRRIISCR